jgi:hypothetical protein
MQGFYLHRAERVNARKAATYGGIGGSNRSNRSSRSSRLGNKIRNRKINRTFRRAQGNRDAKGAKYDIDWMRDWDISDIEVI